MSDKKIIIFSLVAAALLIAGGWYYSKDENQTTPNPSSSSGNTESLEPGIVIGNPEAPVTIEEYTEFLCPACARFAVETLPQIKDTYVKTGKVKFVIYVYPPFELSNAALCAQQQGKFSEFHDFLFSHQDSITKEEDIKDYAVNVGLDSQKFNTCYDANEYKDKANNWYEQGSKRGVTSTPTFFINGQKFIGAHPYTDFKKIIDEKLETAK